LGGQNGWGVVSTNGEGIDNSNIGLPGKQEQFARDVYKLGRKTVVVHIDGKPLSNEFVAGHFEAIIEAWQLGRYGFEELVKLIFGEICPGAKLPLTVACGADRLPVYYAAPRGTGYVTAGRFGVVSNYYGYVNDTAHPLYYFGHGLSYTEFAYSNLVLHNAKVDAGGRLEFSLEVKNIGDYDGDEVVQIYISDVVSSVIRPDRQLIGFKRVPLKKGESKVVHFIIEMSQLAFLDMEMNWKVEGGLMKILAGSSCRDIRLMESFEIIGDAQIDPSTRAFYAKVEI
jgi:beta-glucosidase